MNNKKDITNSGDVKLLVDTFYKQVMADEVIGYFFTKVVPISMETHMPIMYSFWENVLFYTGEYKGNPMIKHVDMNRKSPLEQKHFDRWLTLWANTVDELFAGDKAEEAKSKAIQIAKMMFFKVSK
ncbi:MAG: hemoglobin [Saprospiraceae bacterium]|jgi:hemoglobin